MRATAARAPRSQSSARSTTGRCGTTGCAPTARCATAPTSASCARSGRTSGPAWSAGLQADAHLLLPDRDDITGLQLPAATRLRLAVDLDLAEVKQDSRVGA